jgi:hypothetical protein
MIPFRHGQRHAALGRWIVGLTLLGNLGGMAVTYINNGRQFLGPHRIAGGGVQQLSLNGLILLLLALHPTAALAASGYRNPDHAHAGSQETVVIRPVRQASRDHRAVRTRYHPSDLSSHACLRFSPLADGGAQQLAVPCRGPQQQGAGQRPDGCCRCWTIGRRG